MILNQKTDIVANLADFKSLQIRRLFFGATFVSKILNDNTDCSELLQKMDLEEPSFNSGYSFCYTSV